jgi:hypothetical protein
VVKRIKLFKIEVLRHKKTFLSIFTYICWWCDCHALALVHIPHVSVVVLYCVWLQRLSILVTEIIFWSVMSVHHVYAPVGFHTMAVHSVSILVFMLPSFNLSFPKPLGIYFGIDVTVSLHFMVLVRFQKY